MGCLSFVAVVIIGWLAVCGWCAGGEVAVNISDSEPDGVIFSQFPLCKCRRGKKKRKCATRVRKENVAQGRGKIM